MRLEDLPPAERDKLADEVGCNRKYLYQLAAGVVDSKTGQARKPSPDLCRKLVAADARLDLATLRPDIWGTAPTERAA